MQVKNENGALRAPLLASVDRHGPGRGRSLDPGSNPGRNAAPARRANVGRVRVLA